MPSNKTSIYDGSVYILNDTLDLTGQVGLLNQTLTKGGTTIKVDTGTYDWVVGDEIYGCESTGLGDIKHIGTVSSITVEGGTSGGSDLDVTITLVEPAKISAANNSIIVNVLPKYEIVAIQILKSGTLTNLVPVRNYYPGSLYSDGVTNWTETTSVSYYGAATGGAGVDYALGDIDAGITIEGRWKKVTVSSADACLCYLKATPSRGIKGVSNQGY
tara:strand:+ start:816 stop:1463 length:648 start_codon:yes stop_codon:yes gene_type:complete